MARRTKIDKEINQMEVFRIISLAYAQIASVRIQKTRDTVLLNRAYLAQINEIFQEMLAQYYEDIVKLGKKTSKKGELTFISHNGRSVAVLLSANSGMYGDLILRTFNDFLSYVRSHDVEITILGKYGLGLFEEAEKARPFTYFDFPDNSNYEKQIIQNITDHLVQYQEIQFFYPEFKNIVLQKPQTLTLTSGAALGQKQKKSGNQYLFEPSLEAILGFFESQIFSSLMQQTVQESQLAKFASRLVSMDRANENVRDHLTKLKLQKLKLAHLTINQKQLEVQNALVWRKYD